VATITTLRQNYLNDYLHRSDSDTRPWSNTELDQYLADALNDLWPGNGLQVTGDVATLSSAQEYSLPGSIVRVERIDVLDASSFYVDRVSNWRGIPGNKIVVKPVLADGYTLRIVGWKPMALDGADLPTRLEPAVARLAAGLAYGGLASELLNSQRQQNLDSGRVVDYQTAIGMSAYYTRIARERLAGDHETVVRIGPRRARR
jgi:hypothetical protein